MTIEQLIAITGFFIGMFGFIYGFLRKSDKEDEKLSTEMKEGFKDINRAIEREVSSLRIDFRDMSNQIIRQNERVVKLEESGKGMQVGLNETRKEVENNKNETKKEIEDIKKEVKELKENCIAKNGNCIK